MPPIRSPKKFVDEDFDFYGRILTGTQEIQPRWKRCVRATDGIARRSARPDLREGLFPAGSESRGARNGSQSDGGAARRYFHARLDEPGDAQKSDARSWTPSSSKSAIRTNGAIIRRSKSIAEFSSRTRGADRNLTGNYRLSKIDKPVDRKEWGMTPPTVNAYYNPTINEIVFPAGILQPPFYDPKRDDAMNYGGMGAVIGHEMTHGFDDSGAKFDAMGNLSNWWTPDDLKNFQARGDCVAKQFDSYVVEEGLHENGKLVEGESIADLGGLTISYAALQKILATKNPGPIDGFTPEQRFFLAFAQIWASNDRPEFDRLMANTNPHPLGRFRAIGPLGNMPSFAKAWKCSDDGPDGEAGGGSVQDLVGMRTRVGEGI